MYIGRLSLATLHAITPTVHMAVPTLHRQLLAYAGLRVSSPSIHNTSLGSVPTTIRPDEQTIFQSIDKSMRPSIHFSHYRTQYNPKSRVDRRNRLYQLAAVYLPEQEDHINQAALLCTRTNKYQMWKQEMQ